MGDLKEALGVVEPVAPPPEYAPPFAKAKASALQALVGERIAFGAGESRDAQGLALAYAWTFGDGATARGVDASHAYDAPGEYAVRLEVSNVAGLADEDELAIRVVAPDRAPLAALRVLDASGAPAARGTMGAPLTFEAVASDPEGGALAYAWDLGDGATSLDARTTRAYGAPGTYAVTLRVTDPAGNAASATATVAIDGAWRASGAFEPLGAREVATPIVVPAGAAALELALRFEASAGVNDLEVALLDAAGGEVTRSAGEGKPGTPGDATRALVIGAAQLAGHAPGSWSVVVLREQGLAAAWSLDARVIAG